MSNRPDFSLTQLLYFVTVAETKNISEAAARLHASQSAVSSAMQRLERQLGSQLLVRQHAKGVSLTPSGRLLLSDAQNVLRYVRNMKDHSSRLQGEVAGSLDVGSCFTITPFLIPRTLRALRNSSPRLHTVIHDTRSPIRLIRNGACELAVTYSFDAVEDTQFTPLVTPPLYALVALEHPLAAVGRASLGELSHEVLLVPDLPPENAPLNHTKSVFKEAKTTLPKIINVAGLDAMRGLVAAGMGFMLTHHRPHSLDTLDGGRVALVEISGNHRGPSIGVLTVARSTPSQRARAFVAALRATVRQVYAPTADHVA